MICSKALKLDHLSQAVTMFSLKLCFFITFQILDPEFWKVEYVRPQLALFPFFVMVAKLVVWIFDNIETETEDISLFGFIGDKIGQ